MPDALALSIEALAAVASVAAVAGCTGWRVDAALKRRADADSLFWPAFAGFLAVLAVCLAAVPAGVGAVAGAAAVGCTVGAGAWVGARERARAEARRTSVHAALRGSLEARHDAVVRRWASYELDPALALEYPGMTAGAESRMLIGAMRNALRLRRAIEEGPAAGPEPGVAPPMENYAAAVLKLEQALLAAEAAAGVVPHGSGESGV